MTNSFVDAGVLGKDNFKYEWTIADGGCLVVRTILLGCASSSLTSPLQLKSSPEADASVTFDSVAGVLTFQPIPGGAELSQDFVDRCVTRAVIVLYYKHTSVGSRQRIFPGENISPVWCFQLNEWEK